MNTYNNMPTITIADYNFNMIQWLLGVSGEVSYFQYEIVL